MVGSESLARPPGICRPQSARPQSHRFLQEVNSDFAAMGEQRGWLLMDLERWRTAFQEEARNCVAAMQNAVECTDVNRLASQLQEARAADASQMSDLRDHVDNLLRLNCKLRQQTLDEFRKEEIGQLREVVEGAVHAMERLFEGHRRDHRNDIVSAMEHAVGRILAQPLAEVSDLLRTSTAEAQSSQEENHKRWSLLMSQVGALQKKIQQLEAEVHLQREGTWRRIDQVQTAVDFQTQAFSTKLTSEIQAMAATETTAHANIDSKLDLISSDFSSGISRFEGALQESMSSLWDRIAPELRAEIEGCMKDLQSGANEDVQARLEAELRELRAKLAQTQESLQSTRLALEAEKNKILPSPVEILEKIRDIERRGNLKIHIATGDVDVLKGMDFMPRKHTDEPTAEFSDVPAGEASLLDVCELQKMFDVPMVVEGHTKGGDTEFWETLARNRSEYIVDKLERQGIARELMTPKGLPGKKGLNKACINIKLDIFPDFD